jgi:hypothetical protein
MGLNPFGLLGGVVVVLGLLLAVLLFARKSGADSEKSKTLSQEVDHENKTLDEVAKANDFLARARSDAAYAERMRLLVNNDEK